MRVFLFLLLGLLQFDFFGRGASFPSLPSYLQLAPRRVLRRYPHRAPKPARTPEYPPQLAPAPSPAHTHFHRHRGSKHHRSLPHAYPPTSFSSPKDQDCGDVICVEPLTMTPFGSPCGCVLPMQVEIDLGVAPFRVLSVVGELEVEVAAGIYMKQSQVRIMGASASGVDPEKTRVDIDLVPLGEKFDNLTAFLTFERFWQRKVPINASMFGDYQVIFVQYPGLPLSPPPGSTLGPSRSGPIQNPFTAYVPVNRNSKMNTRTVIIIALSSFLLVLIFAGIFFVFLKWKRVSGSGGQTASIDHSFVPPFSRRSAGLKSMNMSSSLVSTTSVSLVSTMATTCPPSVKTFSLAELQKATDGFNFKRVLGEGGFGRVYRGTMDNGEEAAVKLLTRTDQNGDREFIAEVEMLSRLHHRNLVKLVGICIEGRTRCLVYELVPNGSVESHLHGVDRTRGLLGWDARLKIALGAARGLAYLHEDSNPRVIHRDFKASNVLLEEDFTPKVSDFGLAKEASEASQHISTRVMGTFGYVAPEYAMTGHLLVKSDVYSYGVVLLELLSGRKPVDYAQPRGEENLVTWARPLLASREGVERLVDPGLDRAGFDFADAAKVAAIASMCVHPEVTQRPFMGEVVQALKLIHRDNDGDGEVEAEASHGEECSSVPDGTGGGGAATDGGGSWWNGGDSFVTMDYYPSSGPGDDIERPKSDSTILGLCGLDEFPLEQRNRSGPLRTKRHHSSALYRLRGSMSEHELLSRRYADGGLWF